MNNYNFSLFNNYFNVFLIIMVVVILFLIFYNIIKPDKKSPSYFNFQPYPNISPKDIPDNIIGNTTDSCYNKLTKCNLNDPVNLQCNSCSGDFTCTPVSKSNNFNANLKINGQDVPDTKDGEGWCIPTLPETFKCNSFTGKWVWSNDENCKNDHASSQCWSCECKYPDLFNGQDCSTQIACKAILDNANVSREQIIGQDGNLLVSTQYNPEGANIIFNPNKASDKMTPDEIKVLMEQSPYDSNSDNKPYFRCACGNYSCTKAQDCIDAGMTVGYSCNIQQGQKTGTCSPTSSNYSTTYMNLENDPYMCHINPCGKINNFSTSNSIPVKGECSNDPTKSCDSSNGCGENAYCNFYCDCSETPGFMIINESNFNATKENNKLYGTCIGLNDIGINYDAKNKEYICLTGYNRQCKSEYANINSDLPLCDNPYNPIGYECYDPCPNTTCNYRGNPAYKTGTCKNNPGKSCISNINCGNRDDPEKEPGKGDNICIYTNNCTCLCQNAQHDVCDILNTRYGGLTGPTNLENICIQYGDICEMKGTTCTKKDLTTIAPFVGCNTPFYGDDYCENLKCSSGTPLSVYVGTTAGKHGSNQKDIYSIPKSKLYSCGNLDDTKKQPNFKNYRLDNEAYYCSTPKYGKDCDLKCL
jgi:hypothetical protein